jgi:ubiquinone/menaquinone biosynthesis C-methylase UbiE
MLRFCKDPSDPDYPSGTSRATVENALDFLIKTVPQFPHLVRGKEVLDFGCGFGHQATCLASKYGADVVGLDLPRQNLMEHWAKLKGQYPLPNLTLTTELPPDRLFDVVYSCSSFEHFSDPVEILSMMKARLKTDGKLVISFAEPWWSNCGSHMDGFCRLKWVNLLFSEKTVMNVRSRYRTDGATRYEEVEGGLNRMTVAKFERIISESGMRVEWSKLWATRNLPLVTRLPVTRELLTSACSVVLMNR